METKDQTWIGIFKAMDILENALAVGSFKSDEERKLVLASYKKLKKAQAI